MLHRAVEEWRPWIVRPATRIPGGFPVAGEHLRGLAVAKPPARSSRKYSGERSPEAAEASPAIATGRGSSPVRSPASARAPVSTPKPTPCIGPPKTKPLWANLAAPSPSFFSPLNAFSVAGQMGYASAMAWLLFLVIGAFVFLQMRLLRSRRIYDE